MSNTAPATIPSPPPCVDSDEGLFTAPLGPTVGTPPAPRTTREGEDLCSGCEDCPVAYPDGPVPLCCACTRRAKAATADFVCTECGCEFSDHPMLSPVMCRACRGES